MNQDVDYTNKILTSVVLKSGKIFAYEPCK